MVITSRSKGIGASLYKSTQFKYSMIYVIITLLVLIFLNLYSSDTSQKVFYQSKQTSMLQKCNLAASEISGLEVLNTTTVAEAVAQLESIKATRTMITDQYGKVLYDSNTSESMLSSYSILPEIVQALQGNDVFTWYYHEGAMHSRAAIPIVSYGNTIGCVYMMEHDAEQGALVMSLQQNILTITLILEIVVILFSLSFSHAFSTRIRRILNSMRIIREGDYSHKVTMGGNDELTYLGNEFNDLTDRLQTSESKRRQFVSDASHELKTPLASIKLLSDSILQNEMDMDTVKEFVGDIGNEADRLNRMTQKLLSLTRIESQQDGDCEIVYMAPTIERVVRMLSGIAAKSKIHIDMDLQEDCPILILEDDLYQIIFNLVENGIKYNLPGGKLSIRLHRQEENAVVRVSDTGVGIPPGALSHVFERFYRVDKARSRKTGGSGLGLSIVKNMVERNQGTISVTSQEGQGSVFTVTFPIFDTEEDG